MKKLLAKIRKILKDRRTRQLLTRIVSVTAAIVVFVTTYALVLPAITMETEAQCGIPAHQHDDSCYEEILTCEIPESEGHHHTEDCYTTKQELDCKVEEHQHGADCYDADGNLVCGLTEHTHSVDNGCYEEVRDLTCEIPESDGHQHDSSCYEKVLTCGKEAHTHSVECYSDSTTADTEDAAVEISSGGGTSAAAASTGNAEAGVDNAASGTGTAESAGKALTIVDNAEAGITEDGHYVPELAPINFSMVLDNHTGIYYHAVEDGEVIEDSTALTYDKWNRVKDNTELGTADLLRVYLAYTIPAGALNPTNPVARYRLPGNLHLSDAQVKAISETVNGIASQYVNMDTLEILDTEKYYAYLGIEAVEGTRTPIDDPDKYLADISRKTGTTASEYISATIRVENVYDEQSGELTAQDLVFTWTPYTIEKNQHEYDSTGNPTKAGGEIHGWLSLDFNLDQVDFSDPDITTLEREIENETETDQSVENHSVEEQTADAGENTTAVETVEHREQTADIIFVEEGRDENNQKIHEISTTLTVVEESVIDTHGVDDQSEEQENAEDTISDGEAVDGTEESDESVTGETADAATTGETSASTEEDNKDLADTEASTVIMPAMSFNDSITVRTGKPADVEENAGGTVANAADALPEKAEVTVRVEADEGTFPAGTTMKLKAVDNLDAVARAVTETVENPTDTSSDSTDPTESTEASDSAGTTESTGAVDAEKSDTENKQGAEEAQQDQNEKPEEEKGKSAVEETKNLKTYGFQAVDITFVDAEGNEIEPAKPVRVALTSATVEQAKREAENSSVTEPVVVHLDDEGNAEKMELVDPEVIEPAQGKTEEELSEEASEAGTGDVTSAIETAQDESVDPVVNESSAVNTTVDSEKDDADAAHDSESTTVSNPVDSNTDEAETGELSTGDFTKADVEFQTDSFSVYAIVYTVELYSNIITDSGETYRIAVTYDETSGIPQDAELRVREIKEDDEEYVNYYTEAVKTVSADSDAQAEKLSSESELKDDSSIGNDLETVNSESVNKEGSKNKKNANARFFDIEIWANEKKMEPGGEVSVSISLLDALEGDDKNIIKIIHFGEEGLEIIPHTEIKDGAGTRIDNTEEEKTENSTVEKKTFTEYSFTANEFSVYSVVSYTVDFHWVVNGKPLEFNMPGGGYVSLHQLIEVLGITNASDSDAKDDGSAFDESGTGLENNDESTAGNRPLTLKDITISEATRRFVADVEDVEFSAPSLIWVGKTDEKSTVGRLKEAKKLGIQYSAELTEEQIAEINSQTIAAGEWGLISLKPFQSEEALTIKMTNGEVLEICVTDWQGEVWNGGADTRSAGITINLFDYGPKSLDKEENAIGSSAGNYTNTGINQYSALKFYSHGTVGTSINHFTGSAPNEYAAQGIVAPELSGGYPMLNSDYNQSLAYLFDSSTRSGKTIYSNVNKLLWSNGTGGFKYDSDTRYAYYNTNTSQNPNRDFTLFTNTYNEEGADQTNPFKIGFFPFNYYDDYYNCIHGGEPNDREGFGYYDAHWKYGNHYNLDKLGHYNHHFGMTMTGTFQIDNTKNMSFDFSGDDDMWVFVDDVLVLDIGGIHNPIDGNIDFNSGNVSVTRPNTTTDARKAVDNQTISPNTIAAAFARAGKTWDGSNGSYHEIKVFYLERGGMYSNLSVEINLPFVPSGNVSIDKKNNDNEALTGAVFCLFTDEECQHPLSFKSENATVASDENGVVSFAGLPVGTFYMKETTVPDGYQANPSIFKVVVSDKNTTTVSKIFPLGGTTPLSSIVNNEITIDLSVNKNWQDADKTPITPENNYSASFEVRRLRSYRLPDQVVTGSDVTLRIRHIANNNYNYNWPVSGEVEYKYLRGRSVTIKYDYHGTESAGLRQYRSSYNNGGGWTYSNQHISETGSFNVQIPNSGQLLIEFYDSSNAVTWEIEDGSQGALVTDQPDTGFSCPALTLTNGQTSGTFNSGLYPGTVNEGKFPVQKVINGVKYTYKYYIVETTPQNGFEPVYVDGSGNEIPKDNLQANVSSIATGTGGAQTIINRKLMDIPVQKYWPDYSGEEYTWTAKLQLDYRNVPLDDPEHPGNWDLYSPSQIVEVSKSDTQQKFFTGLPMYYTDSAGRQYRREYSIIETAYKVTRIADGHVVAQYDEADNIIPPIAHRYTPWYIHDAGEVPEEGTVDIDDYSDITVQNMLQQPDIEKQMTLDITKNWTVDSYLTDPDAKAVFQLKRYVITEYRNYEGQAPIANWVEITLNTGTGHNQKMKVPQNTTMYIRGYLKEGKEGDIRFSSGISPNSYHVVYDASNQGAFSIEFIANTSKTITLASGTNNGADLVIGGADGFRLSETNSIQSATIDNSFCIEFELSNDKGWSKHFPETSQESHDNQNHDSEPADMNVLPVIEVSILDDLGLTANTYVYRYFLEEVSSQPVGFNATFTDGNGNELLGDIGHQIYFDTTIKATNRPTGLDILKEDIDQADRTLPGAIFQLRKLDDGPEGTPPVAAIGGTYTGTVIQPNAEETDSNGKQTFKPDAGLEPGYYELTELKAPDGYVLTADPTVFIKVENLGVIKLLKKDESGAVLWDQVADEGELVGNASISTSVTAADGKTITFTVRNEPGVELPSAGGPGTKVIYLAGALLTLFGVVMLWKRKIKV